MALGSSPAAGSLVILCLGRGAGWPEAGALPSPTPLFPLIPSLTPVGSRVWAGPPPPGLACGPPPPGDIGPGPGKYLLTDTPSSPSPWLPASQDSRGPVTLHFRSSHSGAGPGQRDGRSPPPLARPILSAKQEAVITGESERPWLRAQLGDGGGDGPGQMFWPLPYLAAEGGGHSWPFIPAGEGSTTSLPSRLRSAFPPRGPSRPRCRLLLGSQSGR